MARLILHPGKPDERVYELEPGSYTIGRTQENDVWVLHESLSRKHARLVIAKDSARIEDLGSKNGTFVDGVRIEERLLGAAHYLKCGDVVFSFVNGRDTQPTRRSVPTLTVDAASDPTARTLEELLAAGETARETPAGGDGAREQLKVLLKVSELLSSPGAIDAILARILGLAFQILALDRATILLSGPRGLEARLARDRQGPVAPEASGYSRRIVAEAVDQRVAVLFDDVREDPRLAGSGSVVQQSICASMCAPLVTRAGELLGAIYVDNVTRARPFGEDDLAFLAAFASQAAIALDNAILGQKLAEEAVRRGHLLRFFPPTAIEAVLRQGLDRIVETEATILFCDISGYTAFSARRRPREVLEMLNAYFPVMAEIVFRHEGTLEKYVGDALLAAWGAPLRHPEDAERAVAAAIDMQRAMGSLGGPWSGELGVHVGIASGPVAAGNVGTSAFLQYATIGDVTNRAARICSLAGAGEIVIDEATRERLAGGWPLTALPPTPLKGMTAQPLHRVDWSGSA
jgi:adenylate cyclase